MKENFLMKGITAILVVFLFFPGCEDLSQIGEIDEVALEAEYAIPIISTELSISDLFEEDESTNSFLDIDQNGNMTIYFDTEGPTTTFNDVATLPDQIPLQATSSGFKVDMTSTSSFQPSEIAFNNGTISFQVASSMQEDVDVMIQIPELMNGGQMFTTMVELEHDPGEGMMTKDVGPIDLENYEIALDANNEFTVMYTANTNTGTTELDQAVGVIEDASYSYIKGFWSDEAISLPSSDVPVDIYRNWESGNLTFADPKIRIDLTSNVGFPTGFQFDAINGSTVDGNTLNLTGSAIGSSNTLNYPSLTQIGGSETTSVYINSTNSDISNFFTSQLDNVQLQMSANTNNGIVTDMGFITDNPSLTSHIYVELPIYGTAQDFAITEKFEADLTEVEAIKEAEITVAIDNGLPAGVSFSLNFIDSNGNVFDELFASDPLVINSASVDGSGNVSQSTSSNVTVSVDAFRASQIFANTREIEVSAVVNTTNGGSVPVRINANQSMNISLSAVVTIQD